MVSPDRLPDVAALRARYRAPSEVVLDKAIDHVDAAAAAFLARSPLFVLASTDGTTTDASPRGGPPGFVRVLDPGRIAFGDLSGNNRLDSYANLLAHPALGLLFLVPGLDETLRINGRAWVTEDEALRRACGIDGRSPRVVVGVDVEECFLHCAKALRRAAVWDPSTWPAEDERPSPGAIFDAHLGLGVRADVIEADLEKGYAATMWEPGGDGEPTAGG